MSDEKIDYTPRPSRGRKARARPAPPAPPERSPERAVGDAPQREAQAPPAPRKRSAERTLDYTPQPPRREQRVEPARQSSYAPRAARAVKRKRGPARPAPRFNPRSLLRSKGLMVAAVVGGLLVLVVVPVVSELLGAFGGSANPGVAQGDASYRQGVELWNQGDTAGAAAAFKRAISSYGQALGQNPQDAEVRSNLGTMYFYIGLLYSDTASVKQAIETWNVALQYQPDEPQTLYFLGQGYLWLGQTDQAIAAWRRVVAAAPGSEIAGQAAQLIQEYSAPSPAPPTPGN